MTPAEMEVLKGLDGGVSADFAFSIASGAILDRATTSDGDELEGLLIACRVIDAVRRELLADHPVLVDGFVTPGILAELERAR